MGKQDWRHSDGGSIRSAPRPPGLSSRRLSWIIPAAIRPVDVRIGTRDPDTDRTDDTSHQAGPLKIAFIIDTISSPTGGTERQLLRLLEGLDRKAFAPHLVCLRSSDWLAGARLNLPVTFFDVRAFRHPSFVRDLSRFRTLCRSERFDIVQTFFVDGNVFGTIGAALAGGMTVVSSRRNIGHWHDTAQILLLRALRRLTHWYLANSQVVADATIRVERVRPERMVVIRNGLDVEELGSLTPELRARQRSEWSLSDEDRLIGCVANLRDVKNHPEFITAAAELVQHEPRARFVIVGEGPDRGELEGLIRKSGLTARFQLPGSTEDIRGPLAAFDLAVQCSRAESSSNSLIEYMARGLPIVASDIPGNAECLAAGETGLLYPLGRPDVLAASLLRLMQDSTLAGALGRAAQLQAQGRYSARVMLSQHQAFYRSIAEGRRRA